MPPIGAEPKRQAQPLTTEEIRAICGYIDQKGGVTGIRDKALILLTYASCSRRSETTSRRDYDWLPDDQEICLRIEDITIDRHGLTMQLVKTKTANAAVDHLPLKHVSYGEDVATCPVTAVKVWLATLRRYGITQGPLFPCLKAVGDRTLGEVRVVPKALDPDTLSQLLKHYATLAGLGAIDRISGHSLRRGHVHEATRRRADLLEIADQGAWRNLETVRIYANEANRAGQQLLAEARALIMGVESGAGLCPLRQAHLAADPPCPAGQARSRGRPAEPRAPTAAGDALRSDPTGPPPVSRWPHRAD